MRESAVAGQSLKHFDALFQQKLPVVQWFTGRQRLEGMKQSLGIFAFEMGQVVEKRSLLGFCGLVFEGLCFCIRVYGRLALDGADNLGKVECVSMEAK